MFSLLLWGLGRGRGQAFVLTVFISDANLATLGGNKAAAPITPRLPPITTVE